MGVSDPHGRHGDTPQAPQAAGGEARAEAREESGPAAQGALGANRLYAIEEAKVNRPWRIVRVGKPLGSPDIEIRDADDVFIADVIELADAELIIRLVNEAPE